MNNIDKAKEIHRTLQDIETVNIQLEGISSRSFGFGTRYTDIDNHIRPIAESFLHWKKSELEKKLNSLLDNK